MTRPLPTWKLPADLSSLLDADAYEMWDDGGRYDPITLTIMKGTSYEGRHIPLSWQLEFEPAHAQLESGNSALVELGLDPDGYGWATLINSVIGKDYPSLVSELHFGDTEEAAFVVWVEQEETCKVLLKVIWSLIFTA